MATNVKVEKAFNEMVGKELPGGLLQSCIDWIRDNMNPDQVFECDHLRRFISDTKMPEDIFSEEELKVWAIGNGFIPAPKKDSALSLVDIEEEISQLKLLK
jgi:hypothetical protein